MTRPRLRGARRWARRLAPPVALVVVASLAPIGLGTGAQAEPNEGATAVSATDQRRIAAGGLHTCAVLDTGAVQCWGANANGELGNGTVTATTEPRPVTGITTALAVTAGTTHTCALVHDGTVRCWGSNGSGQLGNGSTSPPDPPVLSPVQVANVDDATAIAAGGFHTCALRANGNVACWGHDGSGQLGDGGATGSSYLPVTVQHDDDADATTPAVDLAGVTAVTAGEFHSCALVGANGKIACWGHNGFGQLGNGTTTDTTVAVDVSGIPDGSHKALALSAGQSHTCAVLDDNTLRCWGHDFYGQLGDDASGAGTDKSTPVEVKVDGDGNPATTGDAVPLVGAVAVTAGQFHSCARLTGGTARCWGNNGKGQLGDGSQTDRKLAVPVTGLSGARAVTAGGFHTCALVTGNAMRCWGHNFYGQLGAYAPSRPTPDAVTALSGATLVAAGNGHACALVTGAAAPPAAPPDRPFCWGTNANGELGAGLSPAGTADTTVPVPVVGIADADAVTAGNGHVCALPAGSGGPVCWGRNGQGQLGDGTTTSRNAPVAVAGLTTVTQLSAGGASNVFVPGGEVGHTCARLSDGSARCWGHNGSGQLGADPTTARGPLVVTSDHDNDHDKEDPTPPVPLAGAAAVAAGGRHSCALMTDRTVRCWGANGDGQLGDGSTAERHFAVVVDTDADEPEDDDDHVDPLTNVAAITTGGRHTCALKLDATIWCWGRNSDGQLGTGSTTPSDVPVQVTGIPPIFTPLAIDAGDTHTCARLRSTGDNNVSAACWGDDAFGQLGTGGGDSPVPVAPANLGEPGGSVNNVELVKDLGGGRKNGCAALVDTTVHCWGDNAFGQLGDGIGPISRTPLPVENLGSVGGNVIPDPDDDVATAAAPPPATPVDIDVLANDSDPDGISPTIAAVDNPTPRGTATVTGGMVRYTPNADFCTADPTSNTDTFGYSVTDGTATVPARVTVTVSCPNTAPAAGDDSATTDEDTAVEVDVTANDSDVNGDPVTVDATSLSDPPDGSVTLGADGKTVTYTPDADFAGTDTFTYRATDGTDDSAPATVTVTVAPVNDRPVAVDDVVATTEDTRVTHNVVANDNDIEGQPLGVTAVADAAHGSTRTVSLTEVEYTPDPGYCGSDAFSYTVSDGSASDTGNVSVTVNCVNDGPNAVDDTAVTNEDTPVTVQVLANDSDPEGDPLVVDGVTVPPAHGTATVNGTTSITYEPAPDFCGADSFGYRVSDGAETDSAMVVPVSVICHNDPPVAVADHATTAEDRSTLVEVLANDRDPDGDTLVVESAADPDHGTATVGSSNIVTYTPDPDFCGADSFAYTVRDPDGSTAGATVTMTVTCVNDAPRVTATADQVVPWGEELAVPLTATDADGDTVTWSIPAGPAAASVVEVTPGHFALVWTPAASDVGTHGLTVRADDGAATGDDQFLVDVTKRATVLTYGGATEAQFSDPAPVAALLRDFDGAAVPGAPLVFTIGTRSAAATTNGSGEAAGQIVLAGPAGPASVETGFAGDGAYLPTSTSTAFTVHKELVTVTFTGQRVITTSASSAAVQLSATLAEEADGHLGTGLATLQVRFTEVGAGTLCTASVTTGAPGQATATCTTGLLPLGSRAVVTKVSGANYGGPVDVGTFVVAQAPSGSALGAGRVAGASTDDFAFQARPVRRSAPAGDAVHVRRSGGTAVVDLTTSLTSLSTSCTGGKTKACAAVVEGSSAWRWTVDLADGTVTPLAGLPALRVDAKDIAEPNGAGSDTYAVAIGAPDSYTLGPAVVTAGNIRVVG